MDYDISMLESIPTVSHGLDRLPDGRIKKGVRSFMSTLKKGDSFEVPIWKREVYRAAAKYLGIKIETRKISDDMVRIYVLHKVEMYNGVIIEEFKEEIPV